ncbi:MAG: hypothetical protein EZS28_041675, partial [Streblomastix strix]
MLRKARGKRLLE